MLQGGYAGAMKSYCARPRASEIINAEQKTARPTVGMPSTKPAPRISRRAYTERASDPGSAHRAGPNSQDHRSVLDPLDASAVPPSLRDALYQRAHAALDACVGILEYGQRLLHRIANRAGSEWPRIQVTQEQQVRPASPETVTDRAALQRVHHHNEMGRARGLGREHSGPICREINSVARGGGEGIGRRRATGSHKPRGANLHSPIGQRRPEQGGRERATADVAVTDHKKRLER